MSRKYLQNHSKHKNIDPQLPLTFNNSIALVCRSTHSLNKQQKIDPDHSFKSIFLRGKNNKFKSRNPITNATSTLNIPESKQSFKRASSQKPRVSRKLKFKKFSKLNLKHPGFNIHVIKNRTVQSTKQNDKEFCQRSFVFARPNTRNCGVNIMKSSKTRLGNYTENTQSKQNRTRVGTPNNQFSKYYLRKNKHIEMITNKNMVSKKCSPYTNSRIHKTKNIKLYEDHYNKNKRINNNNLSMSNKWSNTDNPYKIVTEPNTSGSKTITIHFNEDTRKVWKKYINDSVENCSTETDKLSLQIDKLDNDSCDSDLDSKRTVIEKDCENSYDMIYSCLKSKYYH